MQNVREIGSILRALTSVGTSPTTPHDMCPAGDLSACDRLATPHGPEQVIPFRQPLPLADVPASIGDPIESQPVLQLGCTPLAALDASIGIDLRYSQQWFLDEVRRGSLSTALALGPGETVHVSISSTQRKHFTQQTLDEVQEATSSESTFVDRDVLNVTRSSSSTRNWSVSGNASLRLPKISVGANASLSKTISDSAASSAEHVSEATTKAADSLTLLHKLEVTEVSEFTTTEGKTRKIQNPYRDRSLQLRVFDLQKVFCTHVVAETVQPTVELRVALTFDRAFVLHNGDFLVKQLLDRYLQTELVRALEDARAVETRQVEARAGATAKRALHYLFDEMVIFDVPAVFLPPGAGLPIDGNLISETFNAKHPISGLIEARDRNEAILFTTLNLFWVVYKDESPLTDRGAIELATALATAVAPAWDATAEDDDISNLLGINQPAEIFRRLGGFLALVAGTLDPLLAKVAEEADVRAARRRAEFVLNRVVEHLRCHARHYTAAFLRYVRDVADGGLLTDFVREVFDQALTVSTIERQLLAEFFPAETAFLDETTIVVPSNVVLASDRSNALLELLDSDGTLISFRPGEILQTATVTVPIDGAHIEPVAGDCLLEDVPAADPPAVRVRLVPDGTKPPADS